MPKPVLSDSLFNADDVATRVLQEANLQVSNNQLGVYDRSSIFVVESGITTNQLKCYSFNGFMFYSIYLNHFGSTPSNGEKMIQISDSNFYPNDQYSAPTSAHQGDTAERTKWTTDGQFQIHNPVPQGGQDFFM